MYRNDEVKVTRGSRRFTKSSHNGRKHLYPNCGTGLFYTNAEGLPGIIDIQSATYDNPDAVPARVHIQVAERIGWMERAHEFLAFERYRRGSSRLATRVPIDTVRTWPMDVASDLAPT